jgi:hypothetical protein
MSASNDEGSTNRLVEAVAAERREIGAILDKLEAEAVNEASEAEERRRLVGQLMERLAAHAAGRRNVLYPRVTRDVPDGDSLVDLALVGLDQIERSSGEVTALSGEEPTFGPMVVKLGIEIEEHFDEEESDILPQLVDAVGPTAADELADELTRAGAGATPG